MGYKSHQSRILEKRIYAEAAGPGLTPLKVARGADGIWELTFLKDELAEGPEKTLAGLGLAPDRVRLNYLPYLSQDPDMLERRVALILGGRPETLKYKFDWQDEKTLTLSGRDNLGEVLTAHDTLHSLPGLGAVLIEDLTDQETGITANLGRDQVLILSGQASISWRQAFKEKILNFSGIGRLDLSRLEDDAASRRIKELLAGINSVAIFFPVGRDQPIPEHQALLSQTVEDLVELEKLAGSMGLTVALSIYGYTDPSGQPTRNYELSQARARSLAALLYQRGSAIVLSTFGLGPDQATEGGADDGREPEAKKADDQAGRRIEFKAKLDRPNVPLSFD
jgi:outer membrane protein OmpA-like peptidoglycan-associated protein